MGKTQQALSKAEKVYESRRKLPGELVPPPRPLQHDKAHDGSEYFQRLRASLLTRYPDRSIKTIIFCSTDHGIGATTTASHFAATLAEDSRLKVLLVDANLRTPRLHDLFRINSKPGFSDWMGNGRNDLLPIVKVRSENLYVLPCGSFSPFPVNLFEAKRFDQFLQSARQRFDYTILDAPPFPVFSELRMVCPKVDGVILVVEAGKTRNQVALRAKKELQEAGAIILGVVINRRKYPIPAWIYRRL